MTTMMDSVRALTEPVGSLGGMWLLHPEVLGPCREAGYPNGYAYYVTGRGGVLGDVDADVISSAFGFFEPGQAPVIRPCRKPPVRRRCSLRSPRRGKPVARRRRRRSCRRALR